MRNRQDFKFRGLIRSISFSFHEKALILCAALKVIAETYTNLSARVKAFKQLRMGTK